MMMKLLLLLLLALSSVTHQTSEGVKKLNNGAIHLGTEVKKQQGFFDLMDIGYEAIVYNVSMETHRRIIPPAIISEKSQANASVHPYDNGRLTWQFWTGSLPSGAVLINNAYTGRVDYVCKHGCFAGFYSPKTGSKCFYPLDTKELSTSSFEILVNKDNFEILEWKAGSGNSVPKNSVRTCPSDEIYVGKNQYGLGEVIRKQKQFLLPWQGIKYAYDSYETLTIKNYVQSELIDQVTYKNNSINTVQYRPVTLIVSTVSNNNCGPVSKVVNLSKRLKVEHKWDIGSSLMVGVKTLSGGIPHVISSQVKISAETSFQLSKAYIMTEEVFNFMSVALEVPPNSRCKVRLMGRRFHVRIPFTARLTRTFTNNKTKNTSISGAYSSLQVGNLHAKVDTCEPISYHCQWNAGMDETVQ